MSESPDQNRQASVEITPDMIIAGYEVLRESGLVENWPDGGVVKLIVADILRAAYRLRQAPTKTFSSLQTGEKTKR